MKKITLLFIFAFFIILSTSFGQDQGQPVSRNSQADLLNEVYAGYGAGSIFYFTGRMYHSSSYPSEFYEYNGQSLSWKYTNPSSAGTFYLGYSRSLNYVVSMGFLFGFQQFTYSGTATGYNYDNANQTKYQLENSDILLTGIARVTFSYVNKPIVRMYSGIGMGLTIDFGSATFDGQQYTERKLWPGGQLTLMGIRFGRALGGYFEFGFGSFGIINAGVSYRFHD